MILATILAAAFGVGVASSKPGPAWVVSAAPSVVYGAGGTNNLPASTNADSIFARQELTASIQGTSYLLTAPTGAVLLAVESFNPSVASVVGTTVQFVATGTAGVRATMQAGSTVSASAGALVFSTNATGTITNTAWSGFVPGYLAHALFTNLVARTNGRTGALWDGIAYGQTNLAGVTWAASGLLTGCAGVSAISPASWSGSQMQCTLLTRRHGYMRGHGAGLPDGVGGPADNSALVGRSVWFLGTNNTRHEVFIQAARTVCPPAAEDWTICLFSNDVPAAVETMRMMEDAGIDRVARKMTNTCGASSFAAWFPMLGTCQHNRVGSDTVGLGQSLFDGHSIHIGGDSGAPNFILLGRELLFASGRTCTGYSSLLVSNLNALTLAAGLSTNLYQPAVADLSAFPDL